MMMATIIPPVQPVSALNTGDIHGIVTDASADPIEGALIKYRWTLDFGGTLPLSGAYTILGSTTNGLGGWQLDQPQMGMYEFWAWRSDLGETPHQLFALTAPDISHELPQLQFASTVAPTEHTVHVEVVGDGTVTSSIAGITCGVLSADCDHYYIAGSSVTLTATPDVGKVFDSWSGDCASSGSSSTCLLTVDRAMSVVATFLATVPTSGTGSISGTVLQDDGDPAVGVQIKIEKLGSLRETLLTWIEITDGAGYYINDNLLFDRSYRISLPDHPDADPVDRSTYLSLSVPTVTNQDFIVIDTSTGSTEPVDAPEGLDGLIWGYVYDIDGDPSPGVSVRVDKTGSIGSAEVVTTNSDGKYIVDGLYWPANYEVSVLPIENVTTPHQFRFLSETSHSKRVDFAVLVDIVLTAEEPVVVTIGENATLSGTFELADGTLAKNIGLKVFAFNGENTFTQIVTPSDASFSLSLPPGLWFVGYDILDDGYVPVTPRNFDIALGPGEVKEKAIIIKRTASTLTVTIERSDGTRLTNAWVEVSRFSITSETNEVTADFSTLENEGFGKETGTDGKTVFRIPPGAWFIRAFAPHAIDSVNPPEASVFIEENKSGFVTLRFRSRGAIITGFVKNNADGGPVEAFVGAWSETGGLAEGRSGPDGAYVLRVVGGDTWHVGARANVDGVLYIARPVDVPVGLGETVHQNLIVKKTDFIIPPPLSQTHDVLDSFTQRLDNNTEVWCENGGCFVDDEPVVLSITPDVQAPDQGGTGVLGMAYEVEAYGSISGERHTTLAKPLRLSIPYADADVSSRGVLERDLKIGFYDEARGVWVELTDCVVDDVVNLVTCTTDHLTRFALLTPSYTTVTGPTINEGDLIRGPDGQKVWIVNIDGYKRHIFNPAVFGMYGHFVWDNIVEVSQTTLDSYVTSDLYRALGDTQVFSLEEVDEAAGLANKRWLNFSASEFLLRGYDALQIFNINVVERDFYQDGLPIT